MNQGMDIAVAAAVIVCIVLALLTRDARSGPTRGRRRAITDRHTDDVRMLSETVEYRSSLSPTRALETVEARFAARPGPGVQLRDVRLTEKTPSCLRYASCNRVATFLETVVSAAPCGAGSATTLDVVRWLENDEMPAAPENVRAMREDIEAALRSADPGLQVLVRSND